MPKFCRQNVHCLKFTSRHFVYCLSVSMEQKEVFQISFYLYCVTSLLRGDQMSSSDSMATQLRTLVG